MSFVNNYAVFIPKLIETVFVTIFFGQVERPSFTPFCSPTIVDGSCILAGPLDLLPLALHSPHLQGKFKRLYTSRSDGYEFNRIFHHIQGYSGPTMLLVKTRSTNDHGVNIFGAFSTTRWKDSNKVFTQLHTHSLTHSLTYSLTHLLTHSLTYSLTR